MGGMRGVEGRRAGRAGRERGARRRCYPDAAVADAQNDASSDFSVSESETFHSTPLTSTNTRFATVFYFQASVRWFDYILCPRRCSLPLR